VLRYYGGVVSHGMDNVNRILDAGGCVAVGNDAGAVARTPAMVGLELALLAFCRAEAGAALTGADALRAATLHGARALGLDRDRGSLETGKVADVVVHARDPLADPSAIGAPVAALFLDGRLAIDAAGLRFEPVA
jgi:5-methylthioadenosine/S-adenosylhomocysteine deaminase